MRPTMVIETVFQIPEDDQRPHVRRLLSIYTDALADADD